jgi:hypothetical protein
LLDNNAIARREVIIRENKRSWLPIDGSQGIRAQVQQGREKILAANANERQ